MTKIENNVADMMNAIAPNWKVGLSAKEQKSVLVKVSAALKKIK
jgi:hypothetical protein